MEALGKLFGSPARLKLLRLFYFNDDSAFSAKEAAARANVSKAAARKEILILFGAGIIRKHSGKRTPLYVANRRFVHFGALQAFLRNTTDISDTRIVSKLKRAGNLRLVTLSGVFTGAIEPKVDMLVVGDRLDERALSSVVHALEAELGRELRYASFSSQDFKYRVGVYDRLVRDVFDYSHRTILEKPAA